MLAKVLSQRAVKYTPYKGTTLKKFLFLNKKFEVAVEYAQSLPGQNPLGVQKSGHRKDRLPRHLVDDHQYELCHQ